MGIQKRKYEAAFKQEALRLLETSGKNIQQVEDKLDTTPSLPYTPILNYPARPHVYSPQKTGEDDLSLFSFSFQV